MNRTVCFVLLLLWNLGCNSQYNARPRNPSWGFLTAKMNGKEWNQTYKSGYQVIQGLIGQYGSATPCKGEFYLINNELYTSAGENRQNLHFIKVPIIKGRYKVMPFINGFCNETDPVYGSFYTQFDDVSGDGYNILASEENFLQIESYNEKTKEIKGSFKLTFVLERDGADNLPDTLRFTEGKFHTKMMDIRRM